MKGISIKRIVKVIIIIVLVAVGLRYGGEIQRRVNIDEVQNFVESFGIWGILVFIALSLMRPFFFIPSALFFVIGGLIYGTLLGTLASLIGLLLGSSLCYLLASKFQRVFSKLVGKKHLDKLDKIKEKDAIKTLFIMRVTPAFPIDPVSYASGITGVKYTDFFLGTLLGITPKIFLYTLVGDGIENLMSIRTIMVFVILFIFALSPFFIEKYKGPSDAT